MSVDRRPNGRYRARIYWKGREVACAHFARKRDADAWERRQKEALAAGTWVAPAERNVTLEQWYPTWKAGRPIRKESTEHTAEGLWRLHIMPAFGRRPIATVAHSDVAKWAQELAVKRSVSTARSALGQLRRCLDAAVLAGLIATNPAAGVRLPRAPAGEPQPLTHEEVWRLAEALTGRDRVLVLVAAYTGLRWGEVAALRASDVTANGHRVRVRRSASTTTGTVVEGPVKTYQVRSVAVPARVAVELWAWAKDRDPDGLLFPSKSGRHLHNGTWRRRSLDPAVKRAGLGRVVRPHELRDTAASLAIQAGATVVLVAKMLGHETASTTLKHYAAYFPDDLDRVAAALDEAASAARDR